MRIFKTGLILVVAVTVSSLSFNVSRAKDFSSANFFLSHCRDSTNLKTRVTFSQGICYGLVTAIKSLNANRKLSSHARFCSPGATMSQYLKVAVRYVEQRPSRHHENFTILALEALRAAWPCR